MKMNISLEQKWIGKVCIMSQAVLVFNWLPVDFLAHICLTLSFVFVSLCICGTCLLLLRFVDLTLQVLIALSNWFSCMHV